jgi:hypothetical protein
LDGRAERAPFAWGDAAFAAGMIGVGLAVVWGVRNQPRAPFDPVGAAAIPFWTAIAMIALAAILLLRTILRHATRGDAASYFVSTDAVDDSYEVKRSYAIYATLASFAYAGAMQTLGFLAASILFMAVLGWALGDRSKRANAIAVAVAVVASAVLDWGFRALSVSLP